MKVFILLLNFGALSFFSLSSSSDAALKLDRVDSTTYQNTAKAEAFKILQAKCNICHVKRNRRKIFTLDNMNGFATQINTQVFIKKRMPKGKDIKLTQKEYQQLSNWINSLK